MEMQYMHAAIRKSTGSEQDIDDVERQVVYDRNPNWYTEPREAPLPWNYKEIRTLLWIKGADPVYAAALEEWDRKSKRFTSRIERKSTERASLQTEIYYLISFYSVFQGGLLAVVSQAQPTVLQCQKSWIPTFLSVLASAVTFVAIKQKQDVIKELTITILDEFAFLKSVNIQEQDLRRSGQDFRFARFSQEVKPDFRREERGILWASCNSSKTVFVSIALVLFTVVFPFSHWILLCT